MFSWFGWKQRDTHSVTATTTLSLRILTHNVRFAKFPPSAGERPWEERRPLIANELRYNTRFMQLPIVSLCTNNGPTSTSDNHPCAAFICLQEVLHSQLEDILTDLNKQPPASFVESPRDHPWAHIGVGRDDGKTKGEYSPILYLKQMFDLIHSETVWLSPTPDQPSKGWDADSFRILTVGVFQHKGSGCYVIACNTHLDNSGSESRRRSVQIILDKIEHLRNQWEKKSIKPAVFLAGDFNSFPTQEAYLAMKASNLMVDIHDYIAPQCRYGDQITFTGFQQDEDRDDRGRIDFIWLGPKDLVSEVQTVTLAEPQPVASWIIDGYAVLPNCFEDGVYCSDHRCVVGDVHLRLARTE